MEQEMAGLSNPAVYWKRHFVAKMDNEIWTMIKTNSNSLPLPKVTCRVVGPSAEFVGKQGLTYAPGISADGGRARNPLASSDYTSRRTGQGAQA
jgi:hypothetical protein